MDNRVSSALEDAFPNRTVDNVSSAGISWNAQNRTVAVDFGDGQRVFLKVAVNGDRSRIERERAVISYVGANCAVSVPNVIATETTGPVPYLATEPVSGQPLTTLLADATRTERAALAHDVGSALARVHDCRFEEHGHVVGGDADHLELDTGTWTDVLVETISEMREMAPCDRFDQHFEMVSDAVERNRDRLDRASATLLHGDPACPNCFRTGDGVGFLDWELSHVGDPVRDRSRTLDQQFDSLREGSPEGVVSAFYDGYRSQAGGLPSGFEERRPIYEVIRLLSVSGYFERTADYRDESRSDLAAWLEAEMRRRLDAIRR
ncbi:fructosamine-3-kinase [Halogeometricum borinquense DSM 11551]|uniref:Fructosamine-3-kinase n=1 Tax=Halogeometricum borinquense (strain ATCC 700274 / DSM 11551 / JCM 10706 / KCTC 4070 / PR3) TaxID=469382 RepID=E4NV09_HALBP|nr:phosphotransferase [Halogeometricum borinquense]ADQ68998.1 fructosamine-3-kinase [Halogeometricum borinquense DSM 11551]ELY29178.1 fructosamine-3-kinase [Halogeometricum borinquense DSM 11551]